MNQLRTLNINSVKKKIDRSKAFIYKEMDRGNFPKPLKMGRSVVWIESEIDAWLQQFIDERDRASNLSSSSFAVN